jgi:hypothetical protein
MNDSDVILMLREHIRKVLMEDFRYEYDRSDFNPPSDVIGTAKRALGVVAAHKVVTHGGNEGSGVNKAKTLAAGKPLNHSQLKRMKAFFDKNMQNVQSEKAAGKDMYTSDIIQKWELWGGDAGMRWVNHEIHTTQNTNKTSKELRPKGTKRLMDPHNTRTHKANHFFTEAATIGPDGLDNFYPELNPFESVVRKWIRGHNIWKKDNVSNTYEYRFPEEALSDLQALGINNLKVGEPVSNPRHIDYGKRFIWLTVNPKDFDYNLNNKF